MRRLHGPLPESTHDVGMSTEGPEHLQSPSEKPGQGARGGANSASLPADLGRVAEAWPRLSPEARARILAILACSNASNLTRFRETMLTHG